MGEFVSSVTWIRTTEAASCPDDPEKQTGVVYLRQGT